MTIHRLQLAHITKRYPAVVANSDVSLTVAPGETHAVLGENAHLDAERGSEVGRIDRRRQRGQRDGRLRGCVERLRRGAGEERRADAVDRTMHRRRVGAFRAQGEVGEGGNNARVGGSGGR